MTKKSSGPELVISSVVAAAALAKSAGALGGSAKASSTRTGAGPAGPASRRGDGASTDSRGVTTAGDRMRAHQRGRGRQAETPSEIPAQGWKDIAKRVMAETKSDNVPLLSAGVAFYSLLALFPAVVAMVSIYGLVADPKEVSTQLKSFTKAMPTQAGDLIITQVKEVASKPSGALGVSVAIGIVAALWSASSGMKWLLSALSLVYDEKEDRKFVKLRGTALVLTVGATVGLVISLALIAAMPSIARTVGLGSTGALVAGILKWPILLLLVVAGLALLYRYGPNRAAPRWTWVNWGSGIAAIIWIAASAGFAVYAAVAGSFSKSYGSFAAIVVLMLWLYLSVLAVLIGAEIN
ncbi:MAG: YihY/virulence factor BrkB family protein, partial [Acidimicrobiales bacterium]